MSVVESIVSSTSEMIKQQLYQEAVFLYRVREQFEWIQRELSRMRNFLKDADRKLKEGSESVKGWVLEVRGVAYDADDAITYYVWMEEQWKRRTYLGRCLFFCCDLCNLHKAGVKIEAVKKMIGEVSSSSSKYGLVEISGGGGEAPSSSLPPLQQYRRATDIEEEQFLGFEADTDALLAKLTTGEPRRCVVSIVAMGGAGKTTLARKLYNSPDVRNRFEPNVAWVCVSQTYSVKEILQEICGRVMGMATEKSEKLKVNDLQQQLREFLKELRYLIVVDDVWENEAWDQLRGAFPDENKGSRILLTTRNKDVALYADPRSHPHELPLLTPEESWTLFLNRVFPQQEKNDKPTCPPHLKDIGQQMVDKCGRLPLAITVLGGLLSTKGDNAKAWGIVLDSLTWQLSQQSVHCIDILALSYHDLPDYLKPCFLYLGIFAEDYDIPVERLTRLWIAEGFIQERGQTISKEDIAEEYVEKLAKRSMIQMAEAVDDRSILYCRVHDQLREFAISEAGRDELFEIDNDQLLLPDASASASALTRVRRLGVHRGSSDEDCNSPWLGQSGSLPNVRSLLCFAADRQLELPGLGRAKWLRVLDLEDGVHTLIEGKVLGELVHLKYLRIRRGEVRNLQYIGKLYNLLTLDLGGMYLLSAEILNLHRLRHLIVGRCFIHGFRDLGVLQHLHTLELPGGEWIEKILIKLSKLRNLTIYRYRGDFDEALTRAIQQLVHIQKLEIKDRSSLPLFKPFSDNSRLEEMVLEGEILKKQPEISLEFPPKLTRLVLFRTSLMEDPMPTLEKLTNLRFLSLKDNACLSSKFTMSSKGFPQLQRLVFSKLPNLTEWIVEKGAMPTLKHLKVDQCEKLGMLSDGLREITTLKELIVEMPSRFCKRLEVNKGEDWHKIQHISSVIVTSYFMNLGLFGRLQWA